MESILTFLRGTPENGCIPSFNSLKIITARANGLTQTADASKVSYGTTSESDIALLKQIFDLNYYRKNNP